VVDQLPPQGSSCLLSGAAGDRPPPALAPRAPAYFRTCPSDALYAEDYNLQELCELQQHQFLLACRIQDSECGGGNDPLLPDLRTSLASVTEALLLVQQQQQQPQQQQQQQQRQQEQQQQPQQQQQQQQRQQQQQPAPLAGQSSTH